MQLERLVSAAYWPEVQFEHELEPSSSANLPFSQAVQLVVPPSENLPAEHEEHEPDAAKAPYCPDGQSVQLVDTVSPTAGLYFPEIKTERQGDRRKRKKTKKKK